MNAGATWLDQELVRDGNLTTSRGPQDMAAFIPGILEAFAGDAPASATTALRWSPKPSVVAAVAGIGLAAAAQRVLRAPAAQS